MCIMYIIYTYYVHIAHDCTLKFPGEASHHQQSNWGSGCHRCPTNQFSNAASLNLASRSGITHLEWHVEFFREWCPLKNNKKYKSWTRILGHLPACDYAMCIDLLLLFGLSPQVPLFKMTHWSYMRRFGSASACGWQGTEQSESRWCATDPKTWV